MPVFIALVLPSVSAHCALAWHCIGHHPYLPSGLSGRSTPRCSGSPCRLVRQTGTHASNTFSMLSGDPSITSQSSTRAHIKRITATRYHMLCSGHWLPPSSGASGFPTCWVSCCLFFCEGSSPSTCWVSLWLCQLSCSSWSWCQLILLFTLSTLFAEPRVGKEQAKRVEEDSRSCRNCRCGYSLLAGAATLYSLLSWLT